MEPPEPEPDEAGAPRFSEWPEQRGFMQVVRDKAGDTLQARSAARCSKKNETDSRVFHGEWR